MNQMRVQQLANTRRERSFQSLQDFRERTSFDRDELRILAKAGALNPLAKHRRDALWSIEKELYQGELFLETPATSPLDPMQPVERLEADFATMHLTTGPHPMAYIRKSLPSDIWRSTDLPLAEDGSLIRVAGLAICRQRHGTAKGFVFISLEDEMGISNVIVTPSLFEKNRLTITQETFLLIEGIFQFRSGVINIRAKKIERLPAFELETSDAHDFH
jgi:error-prone DNA polymerase